MRKIEVVIRLSAVLIVGLMTAFPMGFASAQTPTPECGTPPLLPCTTPLFSTPTPPGAQSLECPPEGLPVGWGTVTPDAIWSAQCGPCLLTATPYATMTSWPTPTWWPTSEFGTMTPEAGTPTATVPAGTATPSGNWYWADGPYPYSVYHFSPNSNVTVNLANIALKGQVANVTIFGTGSTTGNGSMNLNSPLSGPIIWSISRCFYLNSGSLYTSASCILGGTQTQSNGLGSWNSGSRTISVQSQGNNTPNQAQGDIWIIYNGAVVPPPTPTPAPSPTATPVTSYCTSVNGGGGDPSSDDDILPVITILPGTCIGDPDGLSIDITSWPILPDLLGTDTIGIPGLEICTIPIDFGSLNLFGVIIDLDSMAYVLAAIGLVVLYFRS